MFLGFNSLFSKKKQKIEGDIGYYGLTDWWLSEFSQQERDYIESVYHPMGTSLDSKPLTEGQILNSSASASNFLNGLASWFTGPNYRYIAKKILDKAESLNTVSTGFKDILDQHFTLSSMIPVYYRERDTEGVLDKVIDLCKQQIALAPQSAKEFRKEYKGQALPSHVGYEQLIIIFAKQKNFEEAINLCKQAKKEGWSGDWDKRIARYSKNTV